MIYFKVIATTIALIVPGLMLQATMAASFDSNSIKTKPSKELKKLKARHFNVELGPRPFFLIDDMDESPLKTKLLSCSEGPFKASNFSIGHRGAALQFPEHTRESYLAAARMGAGILECDVTFTHDRELVCRHSQCDLHTTTNILAIPELAAKCSEPFTPAEIDSATGEVIRPASAKCCTSDITLAEFKQLTGKMDASNPAARTVAGFLGGTAPWRTDLYASKGTLMTHKESIELFKSLRRKMTPELKEALVPMPFQGDFTQEDYAQKLIDEYKAAGVNPKDVYAQSFNLEDVRYWIENEPVFGKQAVYLDGRYDDPQFDHTNPSTWQPDMQELVAAGIGIIAPPMWMLVAVGDNQKIVPSIYARKAKEAGLDIITWTLERSAPLVNDGAWYHQTTDAVVNNDGDKYVTLDVLAKQVGILGIFSDWPATVTYYANCMKLK
ncbi:MAG: glycerophosphodiester phosphodiesterase family protein [Nitrosomonas sp.]|nr:glycerophosphodiester phosphodiesterase family protein [Nitrosomonas sp.]